jgi:predicted AAA+ superfamily ATPase
MQAIKHKSSKVLIAGASGTGKTTFALAYMLGKIREYSRIFIFDSEDELAGRIGAEAHTSFQSMLRDENDAHPFRIFDPAVNFASDYETAFSLFCKSVYDYACTRNENEKPMLVVFDEIQKHNTPHDIEPSLKAILQTGRRRKLDFLAITQAPNEVSNKMRNQCTEIVAFRLVDWNASKFVERFGVTPETLIKLRDGEFLHISVADYVTTKGNLFKILGLQ